MERISPIILLLLVSVAVVSSPLAGFGCRTVTPQALEVELPCVDSAALDSSTTFTVNALDVGTTAVYTLATILTLSFTALRLLPAPIPVKRSPQTPPPRLG